MEKAKAANCSRVGVVPNLQLRLLDQVRDVIRLPRLDTEQPTSNISSRPLNQRQGPARFARASIRVIRGHAFVRIGSHQLLHARSVGLVFQPLDELLIGNGPSRADTHRMGVERSRAQFRPIASADIDQRQLKPNAHVLSFVRHELGDQRNPGDGLGSHFFLRGLQDAPVTDDRFRSRARGSQAQRPGETGRIA